MSEYQTEEEDAEQLRNEQIKNRRNVELNDIREMLAIPAGIRFLKRIFNHAQIFNDAHTGNSTTFYNLGFKRFGLNLSTDLREVRRIGTPEEREAISDIMLGLPEGKDN